MRRKSERKTKRMKVNKPKLKKILKIEDKRSNAKVQVLPYTLCILLIFVRQNCENTVAF